MNEKMVLWTHSGRDNQVGRISKPLPAASNENTYTALCFRYDENDISLIPQLNAAYLDLLRIRVVCTLVYLDGVMTLLYGTEYKLKTHSNLVNMQCFESTGSSNTSRFN